jgi:hypothetical protein
MRKFLIVTAASAGLLCAAQAQAQVVGHAGVNYGRTDAEIAGLDTDVDAFQLEGAAAFDLGGLGAQVDGSVTDSDDADAAWSATGHLNGQLGGARVGGFAGFETTDGDTLWAVGGEAQADLAPSTVLYGQAGYGQIDDLDTDLWAVRGELRQYVTDSFKIAGSVGYVNVDQDVLGEADGWTLGLDAEYQFAGTPFSVYGGYQRAESDDIDLESDTFQIGVRYTFGGATLRQRDAAGASLGGVTKLFGGLTN